MASVCSDSARITFGWMIAKGRIRILFYQSLVNFISRSDNSVSIWIWLIGRHRDTLIPDGKKPGTSIFLSKCIQAKIDTPVETGHYNVPTSILTMLSVTVKRGKN